MGLEDHNFCRNPDNERKAWCYTTDTSYRYELCGVPLCTAGVNLASKRGLHDVETGMFSDNSRTDKLVIDYAKFIKESDGPLTKVFCKYSFSGNDDTLETSTTYQIKSEFNYSSSVASVTMYTRSLCVFCASFVRLILLCL